MNKANSTPMIFILMLFVNFLYAQQPKFKDPSLPVEERVADLLSRMTLEEKVAQTTSYNRQENVYDSLGQFTDEVLKDYAKDGIGIMRFGRLLDQNPYKHTEILNATQKYVIENNRHGIPTLYYGEALHGYMAEDATVFPSTIGLSSTWDTELVEKIYTVAAKEMRARGISVAFSPVLGLGRDPRWGRIGETYGEDPYLVSRMGVASIKGLQGDDYLYDQEHVIATAKHYAVHSQTIGGLWNSPADFSERTIREQFLYPFEVAVKEAKVGCIMVTYHENNGIPVTSDHKMVTEILRGEWGFDGFACSDLGSVNMLINGHNVATDEAEAGRLAITAGVDMENGGTNQCYSTLTEQFREGLIPEWVLDTAVIRILKAKFRLGLFENPYVDPDWVGRVTNTKTHKALALETAQRSIMLLKNDNSLLPQVAANLVGGCLQDTTDILFGMGEANIRHIYNNGTIGNFNLDADIAGFEIDGRADAYFGGAYIFGTSQYQIATSMTTWTGTDGDYKSIQGDPNWCDDDCKPMITTGMTLGSYSTDGVIYDPIMGSMVCASFIDSVESFYDGAGGWDFFLFVNALLDDTLTMGLSCNQRSYGTVDFEPLANVTLDIMEFTERNGNEVPDWYIGSIADYDVGSDSGDANRDISTAWAFDPGGTEAWGQIKIPFGGDNEPLLNAKGLTGDGALWDPQAYYDSAYIHLSSFTGFQSQETSTGDFELAVSFAHHDFQPNETYTFGVAWFGLLHQTDNTDPGELAPMAHLVNKWAGFGRGDVDNDNAVTLGDVIYLAEHINSGGPGPIPFEHLGDVNNDSATDIGDVTYMVDYYFNYGPAPVGDWTL